MSALSFLIPNRIAPTNGEHWTTTSRAPPLIPFSLAVGITGHRRDAFSDDQLGALGIRIGAALDLIVAEARSIAVAEADFFASTEPRFVLVSPLADGADQIAAAAGLERGFALQALLPFDRAIYERDFTAEGREEFGRLVDRASCLLELTGSRVDAEHSYRLAGRATIAHCDLLIAVWDGRPAHGHGGTADTISLALKRGTPILHLPLDPAQPPELLWSAFDPEVLTELHSRAARRPFDTESCARMLTALLAPPESPTERDYLRRFTAEKPRRLRLRIDYPLILALAGVRRFGWKDISNTPCVTSSRAEWQAYRTQCAACHGVDAGIHLLGDSYAWSDRLAGHLAQTYRSGHVFNFLFAALSVLIGLSALLLTNAKVFLSGAELAVILLILVNTRVGTAHCWHQRWLDYRQLAERLRPMRSLKLLGVAAPDAPGSAAEPVARRWIDWYAAGIWRAVGCPTGRLDEARSATLAKAIAAAEFAPQIAYNRSSARQAERFDRSLERLATTLFAATFTSCVGVIVGLFMVPELIRSNEGLFTILSAGLPALGTAIFGIRVQGDYGGTAARSHSTADQLERITRELAKGPTDLGRSADLAEQASRVMLADLGNWRLIHEQHELSVG